MAFEDRNICPPRPEYPRPQMVRKNWRNLNGIWEFEMDTGKSGKDRKLFEVPHLKDAILVPFCPESRLSGVENRDFLHAVWYRRDFEIPAEWKSKRVLLHFGAVDYESEVWVNGAFAGCHIGGYTPFSFDITKLLKDGSNSVALYAQDEPRSGLQPKGKQSCRYQSNGCDYTRTTGIWQTVWLEAVSDTYITKFKLTPDVDNCRIHLNATVEGASEGLRLIAETFFDGIPTGSLEIALTGPEFAAVARTDGAKAVGRGSTEPV